MNRSIDRDDVRNVNLITVDLEDWFHICEVEELLPRKGWGSLPSSLVADTENLLKLLTAAKVRATFFVLGYVAEKHPELVARIHGMGHEIALHGWDHELIYYLAPAEFRRILRRGVQCLADITGTRPIGFRAPQWSINDRNPWALDVLVEEGFRYDSSRAPLKFIGSESYPQQPHALHLSAGLLCEIPPLILKTPWGNYPAGGGWGLRCLPYRLIRRRVSDLNRRRLPALFFFHPREFGPARTIAGLPLAKRFVLDARLWSTRSQLSRLLADFEFISIKEYLSFDAPGAGDRLQEAGCEC